MSPVTVLCPTRGRPRQAAQMIQSLRDTAVLFGTEVILVVDKDDRRLRDYLRIPDQFTGAGKPYPLRPPDKPQVMVLEKAETGDLVKATNTAAARVWGDETIIGHVGDDHRFRTPGWDRMIRDVLATPGIAYGDDLWQGQLLPTAVFISSVIPRTLGWYALPTSKHMCIDTAWKTLGEHLGRLRYVPEVVIEHMHPKAGKAQWDSGYKKARHGYAEDRAAYDEWRKGPLHEDVAAIRKVLLERAA